MLFQSFSNYDQIKEFVLCINAHLVYKIHQTKIRLDVDCIYSRVHYLEINDPYRTWQESFKVDELENSAC